MQRFGALLLLSSLIFVINTETITQSSATIKNQVNVQAKKNQDTFSIEPIIVRPQVATIAQSNSQNNKDQLKRGPIQVTPAQVTPQDQSTASNIESDDEEQRKGTVDELNDEEHKIDQFIRIERNIPQKAQLTDIEGIQGQYEYTYILQEENRISTWVIDVLSAEKLQQPNSVDGDYAIVGMMKFEQGEFTEEDQKQVEQILEQAQTQFEQSKGQLEVSMNLMDKLLNQLFG